MWRLFRSALRLVHLGQADQASHLGYVDVCALQRPFDKVDPGLPQAQQQQLAATFEADSKALGVLLERCDLIASPMHYFENANCPDAARRSFVAALLATMSVQLRVEPLTVRQRTRLATLTNSNIKLNDALHVLYAEEAGARWFITVDERLTRRLNDVRTPLTVLTLAEAANVV